MNYCPWCGTPYWAQGHAPKPCNRGDGAGKEKERG